MAGKKTQKGQKIQLQKLIKDLGITFDDILEYLKNDLKWSDKELPENPRKKVPYEVAEKIIRRFSDDLTLLQEFEKVREQKSREETIEVEAKQEVEQESQVSEPAIEQEPVEEESTEDFEEPKVIGRLDELKKSTKKQEQEDQLKDVEEPALNVVGKVEIKDKRTKKTKKKAKPEPEIEEGISIEGQTTEETVQDVDDSGTLQEEAPVTEESITDEIEKAEEEKDITDGLKIVGKVEVPIEEPRKEKKREVKQEEKKREITKEKRSEKKKISGDSETIEKPKPIRRKVRIKEEPRRRTTVQQKPTKKEKKKKKQVEIDQQQVQANIRQVLHGQPTKTKKKKKKQKEDVQEESNVLEVTEFITLGELASLMGVQPNELIAKSLQLGKMVTINQRLEKELIELLAAEYGYEVSFVDVKEQLEEEEEETVEELEYVERPPVVVVMGHVDHGKTKLLDYIRQTNVIAGEAGGITQHIGAYQVALDDGRKITFLDTPGHEAFTAMRARGAQVADIAIIVVAADEGVMPQTKEAINHAKAAGLEIVFAINKIDKPNAKPERVKQQLAELGYLVEDWGGEYTCQEISALTGQGVDELLEKVLILAELMELKAPINVKPKGYVIEASKQKGLGNVATVIVQEGILKPRMSLVAGAHFAKVRTMLDERGNRVEEAYPGTPVRITGFESLPDAGDRFVVYEDERKAREVAQHRQRLLREQMLHAKARLTLDEASQKAAAGELRELPIILKVDTYGSLEAIRDALLKLNEQNEEVSLRIVHADVGQISESDVMLAAASDGIVIGFQVRPNLQARQASERERVEIRTYSVIYDLIEDIKSAMEGMRKPREVQVPVGIAEVRETFKIKKVGTVAGCYVKEGKLVRGGKVNVVRNGVVVYTGEIDSLKRHKDDVKEVKAGLECGVHIKGFNDVKKGDVLEAFEIVLVKPGEEVPKGISSATTMDE